MRSTFDGEIRQATRYERFLVVKALATLAVVALVIWLHFLLLAPR
jgi:hypothetical protein